MGFRKMLSDFALFAKEKNQPKVLRDVTKSQFFPSQYNQIQTIPQLKGKEENKLVSLNGKKSSIYTPDFSLYNTITKIFPEVESVQNKLIERIIGIGGKFLDEKNEEIPAKKDYTHISRDFLQNISTFGQAVAAQVTADGDDKMIIIPSNQIIYWKAETLTISSFQWQFESNIINFESKDSKGDKKDTFHIFRNSNTDSMFFGKSKIQSLYSVLNTLNLDREAFIAFLEHNSFPGLSVFVNKEAVITTDKRNIMLDTLKDLNSKEGRYKAHLVEDIDRIEQIKQEIQSKLSDTEYENILKLVCFSYGYPYPLLQGSGGLGQGEQKSNLIQLRDEAIVPLQKQLTEFINYLLNLDELKNIRWVANEMEVEVRSDIIKQGLELFQNGVINGKTLKKKYLNYDDREITEDDDYKMIPQNIDLVKENDFGSFLAQNILEKDLDTETPKKEIQNKNLKKPFFKIKTKKK